MCISAGYAKPVADSLDPDGSIFAARFYRCALGHGARPSVPFRCLTCTQLLPRPLTSNVRDEDNSRCVSYGQVQSQLLVLCLAMLFTFRESQRGLLQLSTNMRWLVCRCSTMRTLCGKDYVKDLSRLERNLGRTVLVDNDPFSGLLQPCNVLPTRAFYGDASDR